MEPIRLLICDDAAELRDVYALWFSKESDIELVGEASTGVQAIDLTDSLHPDVVLLDINMPEMDGLTALREIHRGHPETKVIMLTGLEGDALANQAAEFGAVDYIKKGISLDEVTDRIRSAAASNE